MSYFQLGQLEDPEFTVKTAAITVSYPGASAKQVELEVTDLLETKIQEMTELKHVYSISRPGFSIIKVDIKSQYWADRLPQVWDNLRKKVKDVEAQLPPGASKPEVGDDFGFVFGFLMAVTSDGFSYGELEDYVKTMRKELSLVPGVARVDLWGVQDKRVYLETSETRLSQLGITMESIQNTLKQQNLVVDSGSIDLQDNRLRINTTGEFTSPEEIQDLVVSDRTLMGSAKKGDELLRIRDIAEVKTGYITPPSMLLRVNGKKAIALAMAPLSGENAVRVGRAIDDKLDEMAQIMPVGIDIVKISWQSDLVNESINAFMINLLEAIVIVLAILALTMGVRAGLIIGLSGLLFAILGTFIVMYIMEIDLQRVSLGAMIIAMGMMVDNAIVVVDNFLIQVNKGVDKVKAAINAANRPAMPLLAATVIAALAFYPIFASTYDTGEYAGSLFVVVAISLIISWVLSQTVTPLMCIIFLKTPDPDKCSADPYAGKFYQKFRKILGFSIKRRYMVMILMVGLLLLSVWGFKFVPQMYFPDSSRLQFMVDYWAPEGTKIQTVSKRLKPIEKAIAGFDDVVDVSTFIGSGPPRFYLPVSPEDPHSSYAQIIVNTDSLRGVERAMTQLRKWVDDNPQDAMIRIRKYAVGAFDDWPIEARFSGPAEADPDILRQIAAKGMDILKNTPQAKESRINWRERTKELTVNFDQNRARWSGVVRDDVASATKRSFDGITVGLYRENDDLIPIVLRNQESERESAAARFDSLQVIPHLSTDSLPLSQVTQSIELDWEDPMIRRWDRRRAITVQASPNGVQATQLFAMIRDQFEAIALPKGYTLEWDGEYDSAKQSTQALIPGIIPMIVMVLLIIVLLFNAFRPPIIIMILLNFIIIGVTFGLLITQVPFGFIALLGGMSLMGMMIKNALVLLDEVNLNLADGMHSYDAVVEAAVSRLRPVANAAATTVFGMLPLLQDVFWISLAVTIMFGLAFGTLLTMVLVPVLYSIFYKVPAKT